jgi:Flp pilus assembly protein TadD
MNSMTISVVEAGPQAAVDASRARGLEALYATGHWLLSRGRIADAASVFRGMAMLAPGDERPWLALGACHEALKQTKLAFEIYGVAQVLAGPAVRSRLARARILSSSGRDDDAEAVRASAGEVAETLGDETLVALVSAERGAP